MLFAALGDPTRLALVQRLSSDGPASVSTLASDVRAMTRQGVSKHVHILAEAGVITGRHEGRERVWEIAPDRLEDARRCLDAIAAEWDDALARLKLQVERG